MAGLKEMMGEYTEAEMLLDVAQLVELLVESETWKSLLGSMSDVNGISQWVNNLVKLTLQLQDGSQLDINR